MPAIARASHKQSMNREENRGDSNLRHALNTKLVHKPQILSKFAANDDEDLQNVETDDTVIKKLPKLLRQGFAKLHRWKLDCFDSFTET